MREDVLVQLAGLLCVLPLASKPFRRQDSSRPASAQPRPLLQTSCCSRLRLCSLKSNWNPWKSLETRSCQAARYHSVGHVHLPTGRRLSPRQGPAIQLHEGQAVGRLLCTSQDPSGARQACESVASSMMMASGSTPSSAAKASWPHTAGLQRWAHPNGFQGRRVVREGFWVAHLAPVTSCVSPGPGALRCPAPTPVPGPRRV